MNGRFLESIVSGLSDQLESATERARLMGIDLQAPHALVTLGGDTPAERPMLDRVAGQLRGLSPHSLLSNFRGCVIILWPTGADRTSEDLQGEVSRLLDAAGSPRLFAGISRVCHKPEAYRDALRESMFAMHVARHTPGPSRVMVAQELGVFQIAAYIVGSGAEWEAVERTLGRLLDADRRLKSDLVKTLRAYLLHERRTALTARFELLAALQLESILNSLRPDGDNSASRLGRLMRPRGHLASSACGMPFPCRAARHAASAKAGVAGGKPVSG
jgi:sugar diacid utilization regulator